MNPLRSLTGSLKGALKIPVVQVREWLALALPAHLLNWAFRTSADYEDLDFRVQGSWLWFLGLVLRAARV